MAAKFLVLFACIALSQAAMVRREAPSSSTLLQEIEKNAADFQQIFSEQLNAVFNSKKTEEVKTALKQGSDSILQQASAFTKALEAAVGDANGKAKEALEQTRQNVQRTIDDLRKAHPDVEKQADAVREKIQSVVQNTAQETQKLVKEIGSHIDETNSKVAPKIQEAFEQFKKHVEEVQKSVHDAASKQ